MKALNKLAVLGICAVLTACSSNPFQRNVASADTVTKGEQALGAGTTTGVAVGGSVGQSMDAFDRVKLSHALDKAPGKPSTWVNELTSTEYTVTPIKKVTVHGNTFCREYQAIAQKGGNKRETTGTACVAGDGSWSEV
jgi:surface antigen